MEECLKLSSFLKPTAYLAGRGHQTICSKSYAAFINQRQCGPCTFVRSPEMMSPLGTREERMDGGVRDILAGIATVGDMVAASEDEDRCRRLLEAMVWPRGRLCPACGYKHSTATALQIEMHLTLAFEYAFRLGEKRVSGEIVEQVLSRAIDELDPTLTHAMATTLPRSPCCSMPKPPWMSRVYRVP
jgi:hypothetical protein